MSEVSEILLNLVNAKRKMQEILDKGYIEWSFGPDITLDGYQFDLERQTNGEWKKVNIRKEVANDE